MSKKILYCGGNFEFRYEDYVASSLLSDYRTRILGDILNIMYEPKNDDKTRDLSEHLAYCGPYYFYENGLTGDNVVKNEYEMVEKCTHAVFIVDNTNIPGTITEIIHAALRGKTIQIYYIRQARGDGEPEKEIENANWYALEMAKQIAGAKLIGCKDRKEAKELVYEYVEYLKNNENA